jgi:hypothetical protein
MLLRRLQHLFGGIYDVRSGHDVDDFLVTDPAHLPAAARATGADEQVIVAEEPDSVRIAVYLDAALLARLQRADPMARLDGQNLADYWAVVEGVSHFVCLAWNARHDKQVSLEELELQAEIDKYIGSYWLLRRQLPHRFPVELPRLLFDRTRVDPALAGERTPLYRAASRHAEKFCRALERTLRDARRSRRELLAELRRFDRLTHARKVAHIERT